ncbi:RICIN domain-containing protein [Streptomyces sp. MBT65]|uniref:RICIN domain-containing protein n=1 Tax=Streptomyces sp. MBT65 TaxID=1488395 RepID=UPI00190C3CAD|nr:RICIN domain-containing protein [Streptomyces sp. MBT65]MBK3573624.1 RICIN domain-containing protein [Streptomyces sp. MBT65]
MTASSEDPTAEAATARTDQPDAASRPLPRRSKGPSAIAEAAAALGPAAASEVVPDPDPGPGSVLPPPMSAAAAEFAAFTERVPDKETSGGRTDAPAGDVNDHRADITAAPSGPALRPARRRRVLIAAAATAGVVLIGSLFLVNGDDGNGRSAAGNGSDTVRGSEQSGEVTDSSGSASPSGESSALEADSTRQSSGQPTPKTGSPAIGEATATAKGDTKNGGAPSGSSSPTAASTNAVNAANGVLIRGHASARCIDVTGGSSADNTRLQIWDCTGAARQKWKFASDGTVRALGKCMDVDGGSRADGAWIKLVACNGTGAQQFRLNAAHDLVNVQADKCVDVTDAGTGNGAVLQLWSCTGGSNQKWSTG